jgi:hypothetical protein
MKRKLDQGKAAAKAAVLEELDRLGGNRHPRNQTVIERFMRCRDWQAANKILISALTTDGRWRRGTPLSTPPGSLPADHLMGVGNSLAIASLDGIAVAHRYCEGDDAATGLARTLVELDLGVPED